MKKTLRFLLVAVAAMWCCAASAKEPANHDKGDDSRLWFPLGLSIIAPPVQLPSPSHSLFGAMVNLGYGQMTDVCLLDVGLINNVTSTMAGLEVGPVNIADLCYGGQVGAFNTTATLYGAQVGVVNITGDLHGLQLGVLNFSSSGGALVFPILNFGF